MCRKSIFVSFRSERLRITTYWPRHIYREDILRQTWWLYAIFMVEMGAEVSIDGREEKSVVEMFGAINQVEQVKSSTLASGTENPT